MLLHCLAKGTEDDALLGQLFLESCAHRDAVKHRVHGHPRKPFTFLERNSELLVSFEQLRIDLIEALGSIASFLGR